MPDTNGYLDRALESGFPEALRRKTDRTRSAWLDSYLDHFVSRDVELVTDVRDPRRMRAYLRTVATQTAGEPSLETLLGAASINRETAHRYDDTLSRLFVSQHVPSWSDSQLRRVSKRPKRYICDPGLASALLGLDRRTIIRNAGLCGRIVDTFVSRNFGRNSTSAQNAYPCITSALITVAKRSTLCLNVQMGLVIGIAVKAAAAVNDHDARHLRWLEETLSHERFAGGIVFYTGPLIVRLSERIWALPICTLWGPRT